MQDVCDDIVKPDEIYIAQQFGLFFFFFFSNAVLHDRASEYKLVERIKNSHDISN